MLRWLAGFGLDVELARETDLLLIGDSNVQETREVVQFAFHVCVPEIRITLATAPEDIAEPAEFVGDFQRLLHLCGGECEDLGVATRGCAMRVARMGEEVG